MKKILALLLGLAMVFAAAAVFAEEPVQGFVEMKSGSIEGGLSSSEAAAAACTTT